MVRTHVQLTEDQLKALRQLSAATGQSIAEIIRQAVELYLGAQAGGSREERIERAIRFAGRFSSGARDVSADHDRYLAEAFKG
ncbi:MAG: ribbon-helix-helix protein, CopG family [Acidobacteriota bacterium]